MSAAEKIEETSKVTHIKAKKPKFETKAAFIRSFPKSTPAAEIVSKAKSAGLEVSAAYVYVLRSAANKKAMKAKGIVKTKVKSKKAPTEVKQFTFGESQLRRAIAEIGLVRTREIVKEVESLFANSRA